MHDLLIKNGTIVDGTGAPRYRGDIAISEGVITAIGEVSGSAQRTIDATGLVVSPGFIDPHTHYDAQVCWDPMFSCSSWHGVTTVIMGHCGVGLAPCKPEDRPKAAMDLVTIESIPYDVLAEGVTWDWVTFDEYMNAAQRRGLGINVGFMAALTPLRRWVMGDDAVERAATPEETKQIAALLRESMHAGALGFSTTFLRHHFGHGGKPLACRLASREELGAYANVLKELDSGAIELALTETGVIGDTEMEILEHLVTESNRPVTWVFLLARDDKPEAAFDSLKRTDELTKKKCLPQVMPTPLTLQFTLHEPPISFSNMPVWKQLFGLEPEAQMQIYRDPAFRAQYKKELVGWMRFPWDRTEVALAASHGLKSLIGKSVQELADERGQDPIDTFLDLSIEDNLKLRFNTRLFNVDHSKVGTLITDSRTLLGLSDAGAHIDVFCTADYCTHLLGTWVRELKVLSLERAVQRITAEPADFFGIRDRGRLAVGMAGDVVVFDPETVASSKRPEFVNDFPGKLARLVSRAHGICYTIVNGQVLLENGATTSTARPGKVLRSHHVR